jgi:hypothetical protein
VIEAIHNAMRVLFASSIVEACDVVDENLARWLRRPRRESSR